MGGSPYLAWKDPLEAHELALERYGVADITGALSAVSVSLGARRVPTRRLLQQVTTKTPNPAGPGSGSSPTRLRGRLQATKMERPRAFCRLLT